MTDRPAPERAPGPDTSPTRPRRALRRAGIGLLIVWALVSSGTSVVFAAAFTDVPDDHAFADDISWLAGTGITTGYPDGTYKPGQPVTRGSMAAFLRRLAGHDPAVEPVVDAATLQGLTASQLRRQTVRWAVVDSSGSLVRSTPGVTVTPIGTGAHDVDFGVNVTACAYQATIGTAFADVPPSGEIGVAPRAADPNALYVRTATSAGAAAARPFHLAVFC